MGQINTKTKTIPKNNPKNIQNESKSTRIKEINEIKEIKEINESLMTGYYFDNVDNNDIFYVSSKRQGTIELGVESIKYILSKMTEMKERSDTNQTIFLEQMIINNFDKWVKYDSKKDYENILINRVTFGVDYDEQFDIILTILSKKDVSNISEFIDKISSCQFLSKEYSFVCHNKERIRISKIEADKLLSIIPHSEYPQNIRRILTGWKNGRKDNGTEYCINEIFYEKVLEILYNLY